MRKPEDIFQEDKGVTIRDPMEKAELTFWYYVL